MSADLLLRRVAAQGIRLSLRDGRVRVDAPPGLLTPALETELRAHKPALVELLRDRVVVVDFETRSVAKLGEIGGRAYAAHPATEVLCLVARTWDDRVFEWQPGQPKPAELFRLVEAGIPLVAHNADGFDRFVWQRLGWPEPTWIDTLPLARLAGLPGELDEMASRVLGVGKDAVGKRLTLLLSHPTKQGALRPVPAGERTRVIQYCKTDVDLLAGVWRARLGAVCDQEAELRAVDRAINDRGFRIDTDLARAVLDLDATQALELRDAADVDPKVLSSPERLRTMLGDAGFAVPNAKRDTLAALLDDPDLPAHLARVVEARVGASGVVSHKLRAALGRLGTDGRLRDTLAYYAAHTGRWSGRGFQPQNLPRIGRLDVDRAVQAALARDLDALRDLAREAATTIAGALGALVRPCVVAAPGKVLGVVDFSSIEPRVLRWLAADDDGLGIFRAPKDLFYERMAGTLFGVDPTAVDKLQRQLGKVVELGCGYQMGPPRFREYAAACGVDWTATPLTPDEAVDMWRDANPLIAGHRTGTTAAGKTRRAGGLWNAYQDAAIRAARGETVDVERVQWARVGEDVVCRLPSGRALVYPLATVEPKPTPWGGTQPSFTFVHRGARVASYGGKLVENVTQAVARDVLAHALVGLSRSGCRAVLHVHDEVVAELDGEAALGAMTATMLQNPWWAESLPLAAKSAVAHRYTK